MKRKQKPKPKKPMRAIHSNIKGLRTSLEMSKAELARRCGVHKTAVAHWENGESSPQWWRVPTVAAALGVSADELVA